MKTTKVFLPINQTQLHVVDCKCSLLKTYIIDYIPEASRNIYNIDIYKGHYTRESVRQHLRVYTNSTQTTIPFVPHRISSEEYHLSY